MGTIKKDREKEQEEEEEAGGGEKEEEGRIPGKECHSVLYSQVPFWFVTQLQRTVGGFRRQNTVSWVISLSFLPNSNAVFSLQLV